VAGYKGPANFGIRELEEEEQYEYCQNLDDQGGLFLNSSLFSNFNSSNSNLTYSYEILDSYSSNNTNSSNSSSSSFINLNLLPLVSQNYSLRFKSDFSLRLFLSGCYYYNLSSGTWSSEGMEILRDSNALVAHCTTTHLTDFGGGFSAVLPRIDFAAAFANASFLQNPVIYSTIMGLSILYIILGIIAHIADRRDKKKYNIEQLPDNQIEDNYFYEIAVLTGGRQNAGTTSKVKFFSFTI
jgi:hypothetical protein